MYGKLNHYVIKVRDFIYKAKIIKDAGPHHQAVAS